MTARWRPRVKSGLTRALAARPPDLVEDEIADALAAVAQEAQRSGVDEIGEQNRIARGHLGADRVGRMPGLLVDRKSVARVGRELHLLALRHAVVGQPFVKD